MTKLTTDLVYGIADKAHAGQVDKAGVSYMVHLANVKTLTQWFHGCGMELEAVAWLHDILEDTKTTREELLEQGIPLTVVEAIEAMSHREGENYGDFIKRVKANPLARKVKIADLVHNMDLGRLVKITKKDIERNKMYLGALEKLIEEE